MSLTELVDQLHSSDSTTRRQAAEQLSQFGPDAASASVAIVQEFESADDVSMEFLIAALEESGPPPVDSVSKLAQLCHSAHEETAYWAITLLGRLESKAAKAAEPIAQNLAPTRPASVRQRAAWALGKIDKFTPVVVEALTKAATDEDARLARLAMRALD
ncbi:HEAT repeat domain-containing protein [Calycomorphotria hydatis]|uniref:HEAT repeat protein n=1 Tax=Calycomorphotria hydatis TaxID=2528027 RepID=A0A517T3L1_9PLAN|nr:HEAT repeat domain-containing protein [Calycomorphotria hydatis]QDT62966.1 hypothetical protein V22_01640 [Calycomorphotria hydatis]